MPPKLGAAFSFPSRAQLGYAVQPIFILHPKVSRPTSTVTLPAIERVVCVTAFVEKDHSTCVRWKRLAVVNNFALTRAIDMEGQELDVSRRTPRYTSYSHDRDSQMLSTLDDPFVIVNWLLSGGGISC